MTSLPMTVTARSHDDASSFAAKLVAADTFAFALSLDRPHLRGDALLRRHDLTRIEFELLLR